MAHCGVYLFGVQVYFAGILRSDLYNMLGFLYYDLAKPIFNIDLCGEVDFQDQNQSQESANQGHLGVQEKLFLANHVPAHGIQG